MRQPCGLRANHVHASYIRRSLHSNLRVFNNNYDSTKWMKDEEEVNC